MMQLNDWWGGYEHFFVTREDKLTQEILKGEQVEYAYFPENRSLINLWKNMWFAVKVIRKHKPTHLFSLGAGVAVPFFVVGKLLGVQTIFMETFITIPRTTMTGRLMYYLADHFIVQNEGLLKKYPKALYWGSLL
jgi:UDP-N-acetylglucosamine:LPS N-acetylglucosamine transferase